MTKTDRLNDLINDSGLKREYIAKTMGLSRFGLLKKINNETEFKAGEIDLLCKILHIDDLEQKWDIFFCGNVDN